MIIKNERTFYKFSCHSYFSLLCVMPFAVYFGFYSSLLFEILSIEIKEYIMFQVLF